MKFFFKGLTRSVLVLGFLAASIPLPLLLPCSTSSLARALTPEWEAVGGPLKLTQKLYVDVDASLHALEPSLVSGGSLLFLAWIETDSHGVPLVQFGRWSGTVWEKDPLPLNVDRDRKASGLSISSSKKSPVLAWIEEEKNAPPRIFTKSFQNGLWVSGDRAINIDPAHQAANPAITGSENVSPFLAWSERDPRRVFQLYVKQFDPSGWYSVGQESLNNNPSRDAIEPDIALREDRPFVTWMEFSEQGFYRVFVKEWVGSSWNSVGGPLNVRPNSHAVKPSIEIYKNVPHVSWIETNTEGRFNLRVKRWSGKEWVSVGSSLNQNPASHAISPVMKATRTDLYLAWSELDPNSRPRIFLKQWDGKKWMNLEPPPSILENPFVSSPSLELNGTDLYLAWKEINSDGFFQIRVNRLKTK